MDEKTKRINHLDTVKRMAEELLEQIEKGSDPSEINATVTVMKWECEIWMDKIHQKNHE